MYAKQYAVKNQPWNKTKILAKTRIDVKFA